MPTPGPLADMAQLACHGVTGCDAAGVTVRRTGGPTTVASSHEEARRVDQAQYDLGDGPCLETLRSARVVEVGD